MENKIAKNKKIDIVIFALELTISIMQSSYIQKKKKQDYISINYSYKKINDEVDLVGFSYVEQGYIYALIRKMTRENRIDFSILKVSGVTIERLKTSLKKKGIMRKYKGKYYLNPYIASKGGKIPIWLYNLFDEVNGSKIY